MYKSEEVREAVLFDHQPDIQGFGQFKVDFRSSFIIELWKEIWLTKSVEGKEKDGGIKREVERI